MSARSSHPVESSARQDKIPDLSCEACNERKVRCDKRNPCSTCQATGVVCVPTQRKRLPRGRHVKENKENKELRERLARLESLIGTDQSSSSSSRSAAASSNLISTPGAPAPSALSGVFASGPGLITSTGPGTGPGILGTGTAPGAISYPSPVPSADTSSSSLAPAAASSSSNNYPPPSASTTTSSAFSTFLPSLTGTESIKRPASPRPRYLTNAFWHDLVDKNPRLDGVLSDQSFDRDDLKFNTNNDLNVSDGSKLPSQQYYQYLQQHASSSVLGLGFSSHSQNPQSYMNAALALRPAPAVCKKLCEAYLHRVDPIVRLFHRPSLMGFLLDGKPYLNYHDTDPVLDVLRSAVFVAAAVSLTESQCHSMFDADRISFIATYRFACEVALDRAGLITTEDITVLQSFVLYLIAVRSHDRSRTAWTLFPIAVRLAIALGLNMDSSHSSESFFEQQMRRRLWYTICVLDNHSSFDRGSEPVIAYNSTHPRLPFNLNDSDFAPDSTNFCSDREGLTDMTKALILYHAQATGKALSVQENYTSSSAEATSKTMNPRTRLIEQFELDTRKLLRNCDPNSSPYAWSTVNGFLTALAHMQLSLRRPTNHNSRRGIAMDNDPTNILRLATSVLERDIIMRSDSRGEPFRWFGVVHWSPLAVAIAECYVCDNVAVLRHVWPIIETSFEDVGKVVAEYRQGMVWKPLERLMFKTRSRVHALLERIDSATHTSISDPSASVNTSAILNPSAYGSTATRFPSSSSLDLAHTAVSAPFTLTPASSTPLQNAKMSSQNDPGSWTMNSQADASWQQMTAASTPLQTAATSAQNNQGGWTTDSQADASFWQQVTPSISDAGWDTWDEFMNNFNVNWNDDMMAV